MIGHPAATRSNTRSVRLTASAASIDCDSSLGASVNILGVGVVGQFAFARLSYRKPDFSGTQEPPVLYTWAMARHSTDANLSDNEINVLQRREQSGWFVNCIAEDAAGPGFAYSFGLYEEFNHPEIIICGPNETMHRLINDVGKQVRSGAKYSAGDRSSDLLKGYTCAFRPVNPLQYRKTCTWTVWFYENSNFPALQLFWPDKQNRFSWEPDFREQLRDRQPDLSEPPPSA
jgi:hypothetical protein